MKKNPTPSGIGALVCFALLTAGTLSFQTAYSQSGVSINTSGAAADPSAGLDVSYGDKGVLIPRVALTSSADVTTVPTPAISLMVYNTGTGGLTPAGFYYYDGAAWTAVGGGGGGGTSINCGSLSDEMTAYYNSSSGNWECNDVLEIDPTWSSVSVNALSGPSSSYNFLVEGDSHFTAEVGIGTTPSSSYDLRVGNNVGIGASPNSSYELSVNGDGHFTGAVGIGTTPSSSYDLRVVGVTYIDNLRVGTSSSPPSNGILSSGDIKTGNSILSGSGSTLAGGLTITGLGSVSGTSSNAVLCINSSGVVSKSSFNGWAGSASGTGASHSHSNQSSRYFKTNIQELSFDKDKFLNLKSYSYDYKKNYGGYASNGLIAEEVAEAVPGLVHMGPKRILDESGEVKFDQDGNEVLSDTEKMPDAVYYERLGIYLLPIVAEHEATIKAQQTEIADLKARLDYQEQMLSRLVMSNPQYRNTLEEDTNLKAEVTPLKKN